jgi:hypothetical protein
MVLGGVIAVIWDGWMRPHLANLRAKLKRRKQNSEGEAQETGVTNSVLLEERSESQSVEVS